MAMLSNSGTVFFIRKAKIVMISKRCDMHSEQWLYQEYEGSVLMEGSGADPGGPGGPARPRSPKLRPQHQNSTKLRPQKGSFRP